jgi:hypothetical protein
MEKIPRELKELTIDLEDMMETAEAIQGEKFADLSGYVMNNRNLTELIAIAVQFSVEEGKNVLLDEEDPISDTIIKILSTNTNAYAMALGLSDEQIDEALKFIDAMSDKIQSTKQKMRGKK